MSIDNFLLSADTTDLDYPEIRPTLDLNFARTKSLDPRITFTRASGGSYVDVNGIIRYADINEARFDHDIETGESLGLLIEEARTNLSIWSEDFDTWGKIGAIVKSNIIISPDNSTDADEIVASESDAFTGRVTRTATISQGYYTISFYVKKAATNWLMITIESLDQAGRRVWYNLDTGEIGSTDSTFSDIWEFSSDMINVGDGWYRCSITVNINTPGTSISYYAMCPNNDSTAQVSLGNSIYLWGAQLERGEFPTSYIPTQNSTRTRAADNASIIGSNFSNWYKQTDYSIITNHIVAPSSVNIFPRVFNITTGNSDNNRLNHYQRPVNSTEIGEVGVSVIENTTIQHVVLTTPVPQKTVAKMATTLSNNNSYFYVNGKLVGKDFSCKIDNVVRDVMGIGWSTVNRAWLNSTISRITYYPKALPPSQLQSLTT